VGSWKEVSRQGRRQRVGHLFQSRYQAVLCDQDAYLLPLECCPHLPHLAPVEVSRFLSIATATVAARLLAIALETMWRYRQHRLRKREGGLAARHQQIGYPMDLTNFSP
jgi:hypothetical protein